MRSWCKRFICKTSNNFETTRSKVRRSPECITFTKDINTSLTRNRETSGNNVLNKVSLGSTSNFKRTKWTYLRTSTKNMTIISTFWCISLRYKTIIFSNRWYCYLIWNCICRSCCNSKCCTRSNLDTSTVCSVSVDIVPLLRTQLVKF